MDRVYWRRKGKKSTVQYSHKKGGWQSLNKKFPGKYEVKIELPKDDWFHIKLVVAGPKITVYTNNAEEPCLIVEKAPSGLTKGKLCLHAYNGYFSNFKFTPPEEEPAEGEEEPTAEQPAPVEEKVVDVEPMTMDGPPADVVFAATGPAAAVDNPRFRGPAGDGVFPATGRLKKWPVVSLSSRQPESTASKSRWLVRRRAHNTTSDLCWSTRPARRIA